jgi:hypothetical protein
LSAGADGVEAASSSAWMPSPSTAFFTRGMGCERLRVSAWGAVCRLHVLRFQRSVGVSCVLMCFIC